MSNDLVARLRSKIIVHTDAAVWMLEAAYCIEQLEAKLGEYNLLWQAYDGNHFQMYVDANEARIAAESKLAEVEAERDAEFVAVGPRQQGKSAAYRAGVAFGEYKARIAAKAELTATRAEAAEARMSHLENHIEAVAKDTHKIMVAYEAALPAAYRLALGDAHDKAYYAECGEPTVSWMAGPEYAFERGFQKATEDISSTIHALPTPTAAELMDRIQKGETE